MFVFKCCLIGLVVVITTSHLALAQSARSRYNPTIIQDARLEPGVDGTFGFQYRTEDGISHTAQGDPNGFIQGAYSYKDPTGLKVNINYFAGNRKNDPNQSQEPTFMPQYDEPRNLETQPLQPRYTSQLALKYNSQPDAYQPEPKYEPRTRPLSSYRSK